MAINVKVYIRLEIPYTVILFHKMTSIDFYIWQWKGWTKVAYQRPLGNITEHGADLEWPV